MNMKKPPKGAALGIGMNYIRFAIEEPYLFRFLFQSDYFSGKTLLELIDAEELTPVLSAMQKSLGIGMEQTKKVFLTESSKSPASIAQSNKQWVGTCLYQEWYKPLLISCEAAIRL